MERRSPAEFHLILIYFVKSLSHRLNFDRTGASKESETEYKAALHLCSVQGGSLLLGF